jgi:hypothetical protein
MQYDTGQKSAAQSSNKYVYCSNSRSEIETCTSLVWIGGFDALDVDLTPLTSELCPRLSQLALILPVCVWALNMDLPAVIICLCTTFEMGIFLRVSVNLTGVDHNV